MSTKKNQVFAQMVNARVCNIRTTGEFQIVKIGGRT